jgi:hypothetical protein
MRQRVIANGAKQTKEAAMHTPSKITFMEVLGCSMVVLFIIALQFV